jgi:hypothetical protein
VEESLDFMKQLLFEQIVNYGSSGGHRYGTVASESKDAVNQLHSRPGPDGSAGYLRGACVTMSTVTHCT